MKPIVETAPVAAVPGEGAPPAVAAPTSRPALPAPAKSLTAREREIGSLMASKTNREIADALTISERTVETHVASVLAKLGLHDRHQVAL